MRALRGLIRSTLESGLRLTSANNSAPAGRCGYRIKHGTCQFGRAKHPLLCIPQDLRLCLKLEGRVRVFVRGCDPRESRPVFSCGSTSGY